MYCVEFFNSHHPDPNEPETEIGETDELKVYKPVDIEEILMFTGFYTFYHYDKFVLTKSLFFVIIILSM